MKIFYSVYLTLVLMNYWKISGSKLHKRKKSSSCSTQHVCEDSTLHLSCKSNDVIEIESALYGRTRYSVCNGYWPHSRNCMAPSAFDIVSERCTGYHSCNVNADNSVFGDPCKLTYKYLEVRFCCKNKEDKTKWQTSTINAKTIGRSENDSEVSSYSDRTTSEGQKKESSGNNSFITTIVIHLTVACFIVTVVILSIGVAAYKFKKRKRKQEESVNSTSQGTNETYYVDNDDYDVMMIRRSHRLSAENQADGDENGIFSNDYALGRKQGTEMSVASCFNRYDMVNRQGIWATAQAENVYGEAHGQQFEDMDTVQHEYAVAYTCKRDTEVTSILTAGDEYTVVNRKETVESMTEPNDYEFASVNAKL